ncbi:hypothetical protein ACX8Z7_05690 [Glutamicibacter endophyticus]
MTTSAIRQEASEILDLPPAFLRLKAHPMITARSLTGQHIGLNELEALG